MAPRKRNTEHKSLPKGWRFRYNAYYYRVPPGQEHAWDGKKEFRLGSTLGEAAAAWAERMESTPGDLIQTMDQLFDRYISDVLSKRKPATRASYLKHLARLRPVCGHVPCAKFTVQMAYQIRDRIAQTGPTMANRVSSTLSAVITKGVEWGAMERHVMIEGGFRQIPQAERPKMQSNRDVEDWEIEECMALEPRHNDSTIKIQAYIALKTRTALRQVDILKLQMNQIKGDGIHVTPSKTEGSSGKGIIIEWTPDLREVVDACIRARGRLISPYLICKNDGSSYWNDQRGDCEGFNTIWGRFMDRILKETKVEQRFTERCLRNKVANDLATIEEAQALLAHTSQSTTKRHYRTKAEKVKPFQKRD